MTRIRRLILVEEVVSYLERQVSETTGTEVCGLLTGRHENSGIALAKTVVNLPNLSGRRDSFAIDVERFCHEKSKLEKEGQRLLALYHSHPVGSTRPSFRDLEIAKITRVVSLILAQTEDGMAAAGFGYGNTRIYPVEVVACKKKEVPLITALTDQNGDVPRTLRAW